MKTKRNLIFILTLSLIGCHNQQPKEPVKTETENATEPKKSEGWAAPDTTLLGNSEEDILIKYGRQLISNTAYYIGPHGKISKAANGMNCQNCHLNAGTKIFGNNYSAVASTYPKYRERSASVENIYKRINDCLERSLNGHALDTSTREMQAIKAYIEWVGKDVPKGVKPEGAGLADLAFMDEPADAGKGKAVYTAKCQSCHGENGEGKLDSNHIAYQYPPLWGNHSYTIGAGLFRLSRFAGYVKMNMPFGADYEHPQLSDEDSWNVAAFVNSQPHPKKDISKDYPVISGKPFDYPFGPFADNFSAVQHKYGPFLPIAQYDKEAP